ncbi:MAG: hypothetical protein ACKO4A_18720 [Gammaproteobacteria bacterium]
MPVAPVPLSPSSALPEEIFLDRRSGRDRRDLRADAESSRSDRSDRRAGIPALGRSALANGAWWLQRGYVDSHHFVENASTLSPVFLTGVPG